MFTCYYVDRPYMVIYAVGFHTFSSVLIYYRIQYFKTANLSDWDTEGLPEHFDAREKWPYCTSISRIFNQGNCISSYAVAVASAISDRICIGSNGLKKTTISSQHIITCCYLCGEGCEDGDHSEAWFFYQRHGVCSGGDRPNEVNTLDLTRLNV